MERYEAIEEIRNAAGITKKDLALKSSLDIGYVGEMLNGKTPISDGSLTKLCAALSIGLDFKPIIEMGKITVPNLENGKKVYNGWEKGNWMGETWKNRKGELRPLFRRDPELSKEQNDAEAAAFKLKYPGTVIVRKKPAFEPRRC